MIPISRLNPWIQPLQGGTTGGRLCCFAHAGGSATSFFSFARLLAADVEIAAIQYPGRGPRLHERPFSEINALASACVDALLASAWIEGGDYGFLGFSFGASVSFAVTLELARRGLPGPRFLALGGRLPPGQRGPVDFSKLASLPDRDFVAALIDHYGDPDGLLKNSEIATMILPALRADLQALGAWSPRKPARVDVPITAFAGREDPSVSLASLEPWARHTSASFRSLQVPGQHFVIHGNAHAVAAEVEGLLALTRAAAP